MNALALTGAKEHGDIHTYAYLKSAGRCIGCEKCAEACPYHARSLDVEAQVIDKCEMCIHRLSNGEEKTMCQLCCANRAIVVGDLDDPNSEISKIVAEHECEQLLADQGTGPNVYYWRSVS